MESYFTGKKLLGLDPLSGKIVQKNDINDIIKECVFQ